jgi:hypothetical protein
MAGAFSLYQFSYRDALRTVGLHGAVVTGLIQLAIRPYAVVMAQIAILGHKPLPPTQKRLT